MIRINLLPVRAAQKRARFQREIVVFCAVLVLTVIACSAVYLNMKRNISSTRESIAVCNAEISKLRSVLGEVAEFKKKQAEYQEKLDVLADLKRKKSGPIHLLDDLNQVLPEKMWLESFQEKSGVIQIKGLAISEKVVAGFITDLEQSLYYRDVDLKITKRIDQSGIKLQSFEIDCKAEYPQADDPKTKGSKI